MKKTIDIVGAGPAGLSAAIVLARKGYEVNVYESKDTVGRRFHGDFQGLENWSSKTNIIDELSSYGVFGGVFDKDNLDLICHPVKELITFDSKRKKTVLTAPSPSQSNDEPFFYVVKRGLEDDCLDTYLKKRAEECGVKIHFNSKVEKLERGGIVAVGPKAADAIVVGITFNTSMEDTFSSILDDRLAPKGYTYMLIHNGYGLIASCMFDNFKSEHQRITATIEAYKELFPYLDIKKEKIFGGYANYFFGKPAFENGRYYVGESAGLQDCLWGFGMRYAMTSGVLAARAISENLDYEKLLQQILLPKQHASIVNRFLFDRMGNFGYSKFLDRLDQSPDPRESLRKHYSPSFIKKLIYPLAHRRFKGNLVDKGCHAKDCTCVWCKRDA